MAIRSARGQYARSILDAHHDKIGRSNIPLLTVPDAPLNGMITIGVIGAGAAGLYTALMLDYLKDLSHKDSSIDFNFNYELLEANPSETHIGGRIFTYRFPKDRGTIPPQSDDYYDVGAMRFPNLPWMKPTFDLINYLGIPLIEYVMSDKLEHNISFFNGIHMTAPELKKYYQTHKDNDPFQTGLTQLVDLAGSPDEIAKVKIQSFMNRLVADWPTGWKHMMEFDQWSTRGYMALGSPPNYSDNVISYLETFNSSTGLYDCALTESVLDALDFDYEPPSAPQPFWQCIEGGTDKIISRAIDMISTKVQRGQRVTSIAPNAPIRGSKNPTAISLTIKSKDKTTHKQYDHVVSTVPLSCLSQIDTSKLKLPWTLQTAIRELHYDGSTKVAIRFSSRWWEDPARGPVQIGGVSSTDRPTRTVVYPSYGIGTQSASMIVSYTWAQDAFRAGSLAQGRDSVAEQALIENILKDLTDMHKINGPDGQPDYTILPSLVQDYHAWNWYGHEFSMGAFALFGPGQFENLYPQVTTPHLGRLHFAGEATSVHHAWVVGALNSAYRSLVEIFEHEGRSDLIKLLKAPGSPFANAGTDEVDQDQVNLQVRLGQGRWKRREA